MDQLPTDAPMMGDNQNEPPAEKSSIVISRDQLLDRPELDTAKAGDKYKITVEVELTSTAGEGSSRVIDGKISKIESVEKADNTIDGAAPAEGAAGASTEDLAAGPENEGDDENPDKAFGLVIGGVGKKKPKKISPKDAGLR